MSESFSFSEKDFSFFPKQPLKLLEVFDYFDGPRFYSCVSKSGQLYLAFWVDEIENASSWLYVQISLDRYNSMKAGNIAIREAFLQSEEGYAFLVTVDNINKIDITPLYCQEIPFDYLPEPKDFLSDSKIQRDMNTIKALLKSLKSSIHQLELSNEQRAELQADIQTIETQQASPHPKNLIIREGLRSIRDILDHCLVASRFSKQLAALTGIEAINPI